MRPASALGRAVAAPRERECPRGRGVLFIVGSARHYHPRGAFKVNVWPTVARARSSEAGDLRKVPAQGVQGPVDGRPGSAWGTVLFCYRKPAWPVLKVQGTGGRRSPVAGSRLGQCYRSKGLAGLFELVGAQGSSARVGRGRAVRSCGREPAWQVLLI